MKFKNVIYKKMKMSKSNSYIKIFNLELKMKFRKKKNL